MTIPHVSSDGHNTQISRSASKTEGKRKLLKDIEDVFHWAVFVCGLVGWLVFTPDI